MFPAHLICNPNARAGYLFLRSNPVHPVNPVKIQSQVFFRASA